MGHFASFRLDFTCRYTLHHVDGTVLFVSISRELNFTFIYNVIYF
jgi:hypothetical protein